MERKVSKSKLKTHALEYFREVQRTGQELIVTDHGKPVLKIIPFREDPQEALCRLKGSVVRYVEPTEPIAPEDWESLR